MNTTPPDDKTPKKPKRLRKKPDGDMDNPWNIEDTEHSTENNTPFQEFERIIHNMRPNGRPHAPSGGPSGPSGSNQGGRSGGRYTPPLPISRKNILTIIVVIVGLWMLSGFFRVEQTDQAVVLRLGVYNRTCGPGLWYHLPTPFEDVIIKNVSANNVMSSTERVMPASDQSDPTLVLTGDENIIHISYTVTWCIKDLKNYLFVMRNPNATILAASESIIREVIGQTDALLALTEERGAISQRATHMLQEVLDHYDIGVHVVQVQLQKVEPPAEVVNAFNDMQASLTDGDGLRIKAEAYQSEVVPKARGEAAKIIQEAEGFAQQVVANAQGEADRFTAIVTEYKKNPTVARKRLYLDMMASVLSKSSKTIVDSKAAPSIVPYLNLQQPEKNRP